MIWQCPPYPTPDQLREWAKNHDVEYDPAARHWTITPRAPGAPVSERCWKSLDAVKRIHPLNL